MNFYLTRTGGRISASIIDLLSLCSDLNDIVLTAAEYGKVGVEDANRIVGKAIKRIVIMGWVVMKWNELFCTNGAAPLKWSAWRVRMSPIQESRRGAAQHLDFGQQRSARRLRNVAEDRSGLSKNRPKVGSRCSCCSRILDFAFQFYVGFAQSA
ncbi:MAG: hypothetical protein OEN23_12285 [Paracoccaceae bacterium]|nr:hypothetical protein [Paracoccaceae bacterium]